MEEFSLLPFFENVNVFIAVFRGVSNAGELKNWMIKGEVQACLLQPKLILDVFQILISVNKALHNAKVNKLKTKSVYSEIIFNLSPTNKINESFKTFGIDDKTLDIVVVTLGKKEDAEKVAARVRGEITNVTELNNLASKQLIRKVYKITDEEHSLLESVVTRISSKDIK